MNLFLEIVQLALIVAFMYLSYINLRNFRDARWLKKKYAQVARLQAKRTINKRIAQGNYDLCSKSEINADYRELYKQYFKRLKQS